MLPEKKPKEKKAEGVAQVVEHLPSISTTEREKEREREEEEKEEEGGRKGK
jgi:hypothetical protein